MNPLTVVWAYNLYTSLYRLNANGNDISLYLRLAITKIEIERPLGY